MIYMKIVTPNFEHEIKIKKYNRLFYRKDIDKYNFIDLFERCIRGKDNTYEIFINNINILKDFEFINLSDYAFINSELNYGKDTLFYNYINSYLLDNINSYDEIFNNIYDIVSEKINLSEINLKYNEDVLKLFNSLFKISINDLNDIDKLFNKIIKKITDLKFNKKFIIIYNSNLINLNIEYENVYFFDICNNYDYNKSNILVLNDYYSFNYNLLLKYILDNYPIDYNEENINRKLIEYLTYYFKYNKIILYDENLLIIAKLINKNYNITQNIIIENIKLNNNIKSFLAEL